MFKTMRRFKQQLSQEKCIEILTNEPHGVLSNVIKLRQFLNL